MLLGLAGKISCGWFQFLTSLVWDLSSQVDVGVSARSWRPSLLILDILGRNETISKSLILEQRNSRSNVFKIRETAQIGNLAPKMSTYGINKVHVNISFGFCPVREEEGEEFI